MNLTPAEQDALVRAASRVQKNAYAPYSDFLVGAAILTESGQIHAGCNVENASYGLAICAERNAACKMVSAGEQGIRAVCVISAGGVSPCGACRQFLSEFGLDFDVFGIDSQESSETDILSLTPTWECKMGDLLPGAFRPENLS